VDDRRRVRFWLLAGSLSGETLCDAGWKKRLGDLYPVMRNYLEDSGTAADTYPSPYKGERDYSLRKISEKIFRVDPYSGGRSGEDGEAPFTDAELALFERDFTFEEAAGMRLAVERMLREAGKALGVVPDIMNCGGGIYRLGVRARRIVFVYLGGGESVAEAVIAHLAATGEGCDLYVAQKTPATATFGVFAKREILELGKHLDISARGVFRNVERKVRDRKGAAGSNMDFDNGGNGQEAWSAVYEVGGKYRIEEGCSQVVTIESGEIWSVPLFTRSVLEVLLTETRTGGITSEVIHKAAVKIHRERHPELKQADKGRNSDIVNEKPLSQYFRISGKATNGKKTTHGLFKSIARSDGKKPTYAFKKGVVKTIKCPD